MFKEQGLQNKTECIQMPIASYVALAKTLHLSERPLHLKNGLPAILAPKVSCKNKAS